MEDDPGPALVKLTSFEEKREKLYFKMQKDERHLSPELRNKLKASSKGLQAKKSKILGQLSAMESPEISFDYTRRTPKIVTNQKHFPGTSNLVVKNKPLEKRIAKRKILEIRNKTKHLISMDAKRPQNGEQGES